MSLAKLLCKHEWMTVTQETLFSPFETMASWLGTPERFEGKVLDFALGQGQWYYQKKFILVITCPKCGEVKKMTETLFEEANDADYR